MSRLSCFVVLFGLVGCASSQTTERPFFDVLDPSSAAAKSSLDESASITFRSGFDTKDSVSQRLGMPMAKAALRAEGACGERWVYSRPSLAGGESKLRVMLVDFDTNGLVCNSLYRDE